MKALKWLWVAVIAGAALLLVGCQSGRPMSKACQQAYEENRVAYDYAGSRPEICQR